MAYNSSHTKIKVRELHHTWEIERFSFCHAKEKRLRSMIYSDVTTKPDCKWFMYLTFTYEADGEQYIGLYLRLYPLSTCKKVYGRYKFLILDDRQRVQYSSPWKINKFEIGDGKPNKGHGISSFISSNELFNSTLLLNDKLTICCKLEYSSAHVYTEAVNHSNPIKPIQLQSNCTHMDLSEDLKQLFQNQECADVILSANGKEFPVHKCILIARSPVFAAMFKHNLKEKEDNRIDIIDIDEAIIEEMLRYIYTGKCKSMENKAKGLLAAAEKYNLEGLKIMCNEMLIRNLTVENATDMLALAHLHRAFELKSKAMEFIVANSTAVMSSTNWKTIVPTFPQVLIMEICQEMSHSLNGIPVSS